AINRGPLAVASWCADFPTSKQRLGGAAVEAEDVIGAGLRISEVGKGRRFSFEPSPGELIPDIVAAGRQEKNRPASGVAPALGKGRTSGDALVGTFVAAQLTWIGIGSAHSAQTLLDAVAE